MCNSHLRLLSFFRLNYNKALRSIPSVNLSNCSASSSSQKLPDKLEQQCQRWEQFMKAELAADRREERNNWFERTKFKCIEARKDLDQKVQMELKSGKLTPQKIYKLTSRKLHGKTIKLCLIDQNVRSQEEILKDLILQRQRPELRFMEALVIKFYIDEREGTAGLRVKVSGLEMDRRQVISYEGRQFLYHEAAPTHFYERRLQFLKSRNEWIEMPGYIAMLVAFKCWPLCTEEKLSSSDQDEWQSNSEFNSSQRRAISAALDLERKLLAIHGPPGTGKTKILVELLCRLTQSNKRVLVVCPSFTLLYHLVNEFCKLRPEQSFHCFCPFKDTLASSVIRDPNILNLLERRCSIGLSDELFRTIPGAMEAKAFFDEVEEFREIMGSSKISDGLERAENRALEEGWKAYNRAMDKHIRSCAVVFCTPSETVLEMFKQHKTEFDIALFDDAANILELEFWRMALPFAPVIRLFGDCRQSEPIAHSELVRSRRRISEGCEISLLHRLDEQFNEEFNLHLPTQYRSHPAIQEWSNRVFHKERTAQPDESVQEINLKDLIKEEIQPGLITDPLVLIDTERLGGAWQPWMFKHTTIGPARSYFSWGHCILIAFHLDHLLNNGIPPEEVAYFSIHSAMIIQIRNIFSIFSKKTELLDRMRVEKSVATLEGQQVEVLIHAHFHNAERVEVLSNVFHLKHLAFEMSRARRQFVLVSNSRWLAEGAPETRELLEVFRTNGRILGPDELFPMENEEQFERIRRSALGVPLGPR